MTKKRKPRIWCCGIDDVELMEIILYDTCMLFFYDFFIEIN